MRSVVLLGLILATFLISACTSDPCAEQSNSAGCRLQLAQFEATTVADRATSVYIAEATRASAPLATATESARQSTSSAEATHVAATATEAPRQTATATESIRQTATATAALAQTATSDSRTATARADNATATEAKHAQDQADARAAADFFWAGITRFFENLIKFLGITGIVGALIYGLVRSIPVLIAALVRYLDKNSRVIVAPDGHIYFLPEPSKKDDPRIVDVRLLPSASVRLNNDSMLPADALERIKARDQKLAAYEAMARNPSGVHVEIGDEQDESNPTQPTTLTALPPGQNALVLPAAPTFADLVRSWRPTPERMILAYNAGGPIYGRISDLLSTGIIGRQGQGKTSLLRFIYAQCLIVGVEAIVWDLHADIVNDLPGARAFVSVKDIEASANAMIAQLEARVHAGRRDDAPIMVMSDEFNTVAQACPTTVEVCRRIIWEGRKYQVFCMLSAKGLPAALLGGSVARDSLSSHFAFRTSVRLASQLGFDVELARAVPELAPGQALFDGPVDPQIVTFPLTTIEDVKGLLSASRTSQPTSRSGNGASSEVAEPDLASGVEVDPQKRELVRRLLTQRTPSRKIIEQVWGITGGSAYQKAAVELSSIVSTLIVEAQS
jgi:hypothetical protein